MSIKSASSIYKRYFTMSYLIKYGYFDFKYAPQQVDEDYLLSNVVYKKVFNTDMLASNYNEIKKGVNFNSKPDTSPIELSIYKNEDERRIYKLPNFYSYISLCENLIKNKDIYIEILSSSDKSLSNKFYSSSFLKGKIKKEESRIGKKYVFKTDIQNFFPSIYTHSIPWILVGKLVAKKNKGEKSEYYNQLDSFIQRCQRGETHGIPTGSFVSRLIAEIYLCKLDSNLEKYSYLRYVDDFEFAYNDESEKVEFYKDLNKELNNLNLKVKVEKNQIDSFPFQVNNNSMFFFNYFGNYAKNAMEIQSVGIYSFIDECLLKEREGNKGSLKLMFKALKTAVKDRKISESILTQPMLKKLFNLVLMKADLANYYLEFIDILNALAKKKVRFGILQTKPQIQYNINRYINMNYHQELHSLLSIFYHMDIRGVCDDIQLLKIIETMDDLSSVLAFELYVQNEYNINNSVFEVIEKKLENSFSWEDEFWFFKYHVFYKISKEKNSVIAKAHKEYLYTKYGNGKPKSQFFNKRNIKKVKSPINLEYRYDTGNQEVEKFYQTLLSRKITFIREV
ncbi:RNA-directed DNA polymerase [Bacillus cereus]|uniref:RNA-directed DNA polymerase n=1 Tax=Bacillus cereus TaxID=1396 RepID=UPI0025AF67E9|nr:RNA-directed DNA polymerase [Bacillus cereus]WJX08198.1 RNA-directed DNA polymerase [Bacillus cereus]